MQPYASSRHIGPWRVITSYSIHYTKLYDGRPVIGNKAASGTAIIEECGAEHLRSGAWIAYTSADSVMQIAAHMDVVPLDELYRGRITSYNVCYTKLLRCGHAG